jgi:hypothetical protein
MNKTQPHNWVFRSLFFSLFVSKGLQGNPLAFGVQPELGALSGIISLSEISGSIAFGSNDGVGEFHHSKSRIITIYSGEKFPYQEYPASAVGK